jgi:cytochrome P450
MKVWRGIVLTLNRAVYRLTCRALSHPFLLKMFFAGVRRVRPIAIIGGNVIVTKHDDVREVLQRFDDFTLAEYTQSKMLGGSFLLSIDWREQHTRERKLLGSVVQRSHDIRWIEKLAANKCQEIIGGTDRSSSGKYEIDVAKLAEEVALEIVTTYFGVRGVPADNLRRLAAVILVEPPPGTREWFAAREAILDLTNTLSKCIKSQSAVHHIAPRAKDDLLKRLVRLMHANADRPRWFTEDWIRRYLTGLAVFGNQTITQTVAHALDQLLARPEMLRRAKRAAARLTACQSSAETSQLVEARTRLQQFVYEALRFRPMLPLLARYSPRETILAKGTRRQRRVPAGARVVAGPLAAMFDPEVFARPWQFCSARPLEDYLHLGDGPHVCFGKYVADTQIIEIMRTLLLLKDLQRTPGPRGRLRYDGPAVTSLRVDFAARKPARSVE